MKKNTILKTLFVLMLVVAIAQTGIAFEGKTIASSDDGGYHKSCYPTPQPTHTVKPTPTHTAKPTPDPTATAAPTPVKTPVKTPKPTPVATPTTQPTSQPTAAPTTQPTTQPTTAPTVQPTVAPTTPPATDPGNNPTQSFGGGSSGGGSCGRDVHSDEPLANTRKHETNEEFVSIYKKSVDYKFKTLEFLKGAGFSPNSTENCVSAQGELLKGRSANTKPPEAKGPIVFFNVWIGGIGYSDSPKVKDRYIELAIPGELREKREVSLMLYKNGSWAEVSFEKRGENFRATVPSFGYYALTEKAAPAMKAETNQTASAGKDEAEKGSSDMTNSYLALLIAAIILIAITIAYSRRKK
jgi:PGF-pre-PGF domain-containing protein